MREIKTADVASESFSANLLALPNETIHFTGRNLPLFRELARAPVRPQLFIIYIQEYHAHDIRAHASFLLVMRAGSSSFVVPSEKNKINY